eukprot:14814487-Alexandrium_andersonii.AAC.1
MACHISIFFLWPGSLRQPEHPGLVRDIRSSVPVNSDAFIGHLCTEHQPGNHVGCMHYAAMAAYAWKALASVRYEGPGQQNPERS